MKLKFIFFLLLFAYSNLYASSANNKSICLNMIVKDEKDVIERCLASVKPFIDYWVIVDTGSTDGTQQVIKEFLKDVPGELYERPWLNFGHNRNEALQLAKFKADYVLIMDADDFLTYAQDFKFPALEKDGYHFIFDDCGSNYYRTQLVNNHINWQWYGVLHEYLGSTESKSYEDLKGITYVRYYDGARSKDPEKYLKDVQVLEDALKKEPGNLRYAFYLAESYRSAQLFEKAIEAYEKRVALGGWDEEVFWSLLQIGYLKELLEKPGKEIVDAYTKAFEFRPTRAEPLYHIARYFRNIGYFHAANVYALQGLSIPKPNDLLFVESWVYDYGLLFEYSIIAYWVEDYLAAQKASRDLLANPRLPENYRNCVISNLEWINGKLNGSK
jgi:glycosyltransferase involved in cell wall biosynthesis